MMIGKQRVNSYMTLEYSFVGMRVVSGMLTPVTWEISVDIAVPEKKNKSREENEHNATMAYQKLFFFLDTNLPNSIMVNVESEQDMMIANTTNNITVYCPGHPYDDLIVRLLHCKFVSLSYGELSIGDMRIKSTDMSVTYTFGGNEYELPENVSDYITMPCESKFAEPWWDRDDGFCFEFLKPMNMVDSDEDPFKNIVDPIEEFYRIIAESAPEQEREPARIIKVDKWVPKKI